MIARSLLLWAMATIPTAAAAQRPSTPNDPRPSRQALLVAEDGRGSTEAELAPLFQGLTSRDPVTASIAVRAIGRFERPSLAGRLLPLLVDGRVVVRIATAHALGQIGQDTVAVPSIAPLLIERIGEEQDVTVLAALARSVGRLPFRSTDRAQAAQVALLALAGKPLPAEQRVEVIRALESLVRINRPVLEPNPDLVARLRASAGFTDRDVESAARVRRAAVAALSRVTRPEDTVLVQLGADPDAEVRRLAILWAASDSAALVGRRNYVTAALADRNPMVRVEALRVWGRHFQADNCGPVIRAVRDRDWHVALQAIELLGNPCPGVVNAADVLWPMVDSLAGSQRGDFTTVANWHRGAYALLSLSRIDPNRAKAVLSRAGAARAWQIRMYAARAAAIVGDGDRLVTFADDVHDNVREAAIPGLLRVRGHGVDSVFRIQLARTDYQLVMAAAAALEGSPDRPRAVAALKAALARITAERKETSRDARIAILDRLAELGQADDAPALESYLTDFDPEIARRAATLIRTWTGQRREITPRPLPRRPLDADNIDRFRGAKLRVAMAAHSGGGSFEIALYPDLAPATVARVAALAQQGYYDGLTFHRVVANFVIQGGSPRANEYAGDALYLRDEISPVAHERGTLGISTRGRDTGDAQIFVNMVDNLRLDFNYTVWGRVTAGMDVVDSILEGDVIDRIDVIDAAGSSDQR